MPASKTLSDIFGLYIPSLDSTDEQKANAVDLAHRLNNFKLHPILRKLNERMANYFSIVAYRSNNITRIHLFLREMVCIKKNPEKNGEYEPIFSDKFKYITTITLSDFIEIPDIYYYKSNSADALIVDFEKSVEYEINPSGKLNLNLEFFFENYFLNAGDTDMAANLYDEYATIPQINSEIANMCSGVWFSSNDIRWQISLVGLVHSYYSNHGCHIPFLKTREYTFGNKYNFYTHRHNPNNKIENVYFKTLETSCDNCERKLPDFFYNSPYCGDLCEECYTEKGKVEEKRKNYLKYLFMLPARRAVFKKRVSILKNRLSGMKLPEITPEKKIDIYKRVIQNVAYDNSLSKSSCPICMDYFVKSAESRDISSGMCGHCFHTKCIRDTGTSKCPVCRKITVFTNLFLAL